MTPSNRNAGIEQPGPSPFLKIVPFLFIGAVLLFFTFGFGTVFPNGFRWEGPRTHEGVVTVPEGDWERAIWTSAEALREDAAVAAEGGRNGVNAMRTCVAAPPEARQAIEQALRGGDPASAGSLWVRTVAERRIGEWPCLATAHKVKIGEQLRIQRIVEARPLGCDLLVFQRNGLRCPVPTPPPGPVGLDDQGNSFYPAAAVAAEAEGTTIVRLLVSGSDGVLSCEVVESSGNTDLDGATCAMLRKRPQMIRKKGKTHGMARGVREVTQTVVWKLEN